MPIAMFETEGAIVGGLFFSLPTLLCFISYFLRLGYSYLSRSDISLNARNRLPTGLKMSFEALQYTAAIEGGLMGLGLGVGTLTAARKSASTLEAFAVLIVGVMSTIQILAGYACAIYFIEALDTGELLNLTDWLNIRQRRPFRLTRMYLASRRKKASLKNSSCVGDESELPLFSSSADRGRYEKEGLVRNATEGQLEILFT